MSLTLLYVHLLGVYCFLSVTYFLRGVTGSKPNFVDFFEAFIWEVTIFGIIGSVIRAVKMVMADKTEEPVSKPNLKIKNEKKEGK